MIVEIVQQSATLFQQSLAFNFLLKLFWGQIYSVSNSN